MVAWWQHLYELRRKLKNSFSARFGVGLSNPARAVSAENCALFNEVVGLTAAAFRA